MRLKPKFWWLLSLLFFAASLWLWHAGDRMAASRRAAAVSSNAPVPSVPSVPLLPSNTAPAPAPRAYRLSNTPQTLAQLERNSRAILLRNALIDTSLRVTLPIPPALRSHGAPGSYLVQSDRPLNKQFYAALRQDGAEFVSYIPNNTALVRATPEAARTMVADRLFQAVLPYEPYFKLDGTLLPGAVNGELLTNNQLRVTVLPGQDAAAAQALAALGASVTGREATPFGSTTFFVTAPPDQLVAVAQLPQTQEIESFSPRQMLNDLTRVRLAVTTDTLVQTNYLGLTGTNIWMVLNDTGVDATHKDFAPATRLLASIPSALTDADGHGTHVAETMLGGGNESYTVSNAIPGSITPTSNLFRGMAPKASLFVQQVDMWSGPFISDSWLQSNASFNLEAMAATNSAMLSNGFINNCSWGYQSTVYDLSAASYDGATRDSQPYAPGRHPMLFVVAAGNGNQAVGSILSPATAKNVIAVGAIDSPRFISGENSTFDSNYVAPFSSGGNVGVGTESDYGRFKPDVVAPGVFTVSARSTSFKDPTALPILNYNDFPNQSVLPGQSNVYPVTLLTGTTNLVIQVLPNQLSPVPFPTNLQVYFDINDPPQTPAIVATNAAGLPVVINPAIGDGFVMVSSPTNQPWPVAYELRVYGILTNTIYSNYYQNLATNLNTNLLPYYRYESGTSMAAGAVSGMLALMQQYLKDTVKVTPSPALLKALLINGARPLNAYSDLNPAPGVNLEGYGLPCLSNSIPASLASNTYSMKFYDQSNALQTGESHTYTVSMPNGNATNYPLRITLVWTDPPGNPAAGLALVNNLNLVVSNNTGSNNIFVGNDFLSGDIYTEPSSPTNMAASDIVNNVQNVYLDASLGLVPPYTVTVSGARVNVNADGTQTNIIGQDYALVISTDDTADGLTVTGPTDQIATTALITTVNNGTVLLHQRVGANEPNTNQYPGGGLYPTAAYPGNTNGNLSQWHFYTFQNINYNETNTSLTNSGGTNIASYFTNAIIATFFPATLTTPDSSPVNLSYPAAQNADIDLYVSSNAALFNLDPATIASASKSVGQGGSETVLLTNIAGVSNFYIGVKCETQQGADFDLFATIATNFDNGDLYGNNPFTVSAYGLPVVIPDTYDPEGEEGADVLAFVASPVLVRKVAATVGILHANPADLYGTFSHGGEQAVLNHYTGAPGGFTNTYDDIPDGTVNALDNLYPIVPSDGPGNLQNFVGLSAAGQWILNERDDVFTQTGMVTMLTLEIWPQPPLVGASGGLDSTNIITLETNGVTGNYSGFFDVPNDATNLIIGVIFTDPQGKVGIYLTNQPVATTNDYGTNVTAPGGFLSLGTTPPSMGPPLTGGRWYYLITDESSDQATIGNFTITNFIIIQESGTPNLTLTLFNTNTTPLLTGAHTDSQICVTNGILSSNQQLASLQVGVCLADTNADNLVLYLLSPEGTSTELFDSRGGPLATNLGLLTTNGGCIYFTFTDNAFLGPDLIKFFPPPFGQLLTNVNILDSSFEVTPGDYGQSNALLADVLSTNLEVWTVISNDVAVVASEDLYQAANVTNNYLALADGVMTTALPTAAGQAYTLTFDSRGPGLLDWWRFDGDFDDSIGTNNGTLTGTGVTFIPGEVGQAIQFPGTTLSPNGAGITFGTNAGNFGAHDFTIDYWMNTTSTKTEEAFLGNRYICNLGNWWDIRVGTGGTFPPTGGPKAGVVHFECGDGTVAGQVSLFIVNAVNDGLWHHVAITRRGAVYSGYLDGKSNAIYSAPGVANVSHSTTMTLGQNICQGHDDTVPYSGAVDELDLWNRALTDVEIAAIYQAGTNHIGKATPVSIFPNCEILVASGTDTVTNTVIATNAAGTNWTTNAVYFTALDTNTTITLRGNPLGMLLDDFLVQTPANLNYVQPEEPLAPLIGQNPYGCWTLDVWDTRTDSAASNNGVLYGWNLQMTVSSTNTSLIVLTNGIPYAGAVNSNSIAYFAFDVTNGVNFDTNLLFDCSQNLNLLFNQTALPVGSQLGDYTLLTNVLNGTNVLAAGTAPPSFVPGARYFLGVQNTNSVAASFTIEIFTNNVTAGTNPIFHLGATVTSAVISNAPQYYSFTVPTIATSASFDIININPATNELDLYVRHALPLPSDTTFDYEASYLGTNGEPIVVTTNSAPVPLTPGTWYLAVYNYNTNSTNSYQVVATFNTSTGSTSAVVSVTGMSVGTNHFTLNWLAVAGGLYAVDISTNLINWTKAADITAGSLIASYTDPAPIAGQGARFYRVLKLPAAVLPAVSAGAGQFTLNWPSAPGGQYEVDVSTDLLHWTKAAAVTTIGATGSFSDAVIQKGARFYQVSRTQ